MLGLPTSPGTWCSLITAAGAAWPQTSEASVPQRVWAAPCLDVPGSPFLVGPLCPALFLALYTTCPFPWPQARPCLIQQPLFSLTPAIKGARQGPLSFPWGHLIPGQLGDAVPHLVSHLVCIYAISAPHLRPHVSSDLLSC